MIYGENRVDEPYSSVQAYSIAPQNSKIISGGDDGDVQVNQGYTFSWVYNPNGVSGFTGVSWFDDVDGSPLNYSGITAEEINSQFENSNRQDLNDIFRTWQDYLALNDSAASDFAKYLTLNNAYGCWR